jgi:hypothetical protein
MSDPDPAKQNITNINTAVSGKNNVVNSSVKRSSAERKKFFVVGIALLILAAGLAVWGFALGTLTPDQRRILLWALPLASGFGCGSFAGSIAAEGKGLITGLVVTATGGFAVWLITFFVLFR